MGLLDEAIREHLELKRKHGAGDDEVKRQEAEALGPVRREPAEQASDEAAGAPAEPVAEPHPEPMPEDVPHPAENDHAVPSEDDVAAPHGDPFEELPDPESLHESAPAEVVEPADQPTEIVEQPTEPHDALGDPAAAGEDVLEETPEFLQETPEHDRLWFEQKPPRKFDFEDE